MKLFELSETESKKTLARDLGDRQIQREMVVRAGEEKLRLILKQHQNLGFRERIRRGLELTRAWREIRRENRKGEGLKLGD